MSKSLDSLLSRTVNPFTPLCMGDLTVGWVAPHVDCVGGDDGDWLVAVGDEVFNLSFSWFLTRCNRLGLKVPRGVQVALGYEADLLMNMPVESIDINDGVRVNYTERTTQNLLAALTNFVRVLKSDTQSKFNNEDTRQAAKTYVMLLGWGYPYMTELLWRGTRPISSLETLSYEILKAHPLVANKMEGLEE